MLFRSNPLSHSRSNILETPSECIFGPGNIRQRGIFNIFPAHLRGGRSPVSHAVSQQRKIPEDIIFKPKIFPEYIFGLGTPELAPIVPGALLQLDHLRPAGSNSRLLERGDPMHADPSAQVPATRRDDRPAARRRAMGCKHRFIPFDPHFSQR